MINDNVLKGNWKVLKGEIQKKWGQLTGDDLDRVEGDATKMVGLMQTKLGYKQEEARGMLNDFLKQHDPKAPKN